MTHTDIEREYTIDESGRITKPGMFQGEKIYVPYYWNMYMEGFYDSDHGGILGFYVIAEDKQLFPELKGRKAVKLYQRDDGFVCEV